MSLSISGLANQTIPYDFPGCDAQPSDLVSNYFIIKGDEVCKFAHSFHAGLSVVGAVVGMVIPPMGATITAISHAPKILRNIVCYKMPVHKAIYGNSPEGIASFAAAVINVVFPQSRLLNLGSSTLNLLDESLQMVKQENKMIQELSAASEMQNSTTVKEVVSSMRLHSLEAGNNCNLLFNAVDRNEPAMVEMLGNVDQANLHPLDKLGNTPLGRAVALNRAAVVKAFCDLPGINLNTVNAAGLTPIEIAVNKGYVDVARVLAKSGASIEVYGRDGVGLAHRCYNTNSPEMLRALSENMDFDPYSLDQHGKTIFDRATEDKKSKWIELLEELEAE